MDKPKTLTLVRRSETDERAERILTEALRGRGGSLTKADAVALTGLPAEQTESALRTLLSRYRSHLAVTDSGELVYRFDPAMQRRNAPTLADHLRAATTALGRALTFLFKIWIVTTLVVYTAAFFLMMLALVFARSGGGGSSRDDDRDGGFGISPWLMWWLLPDFGGRGDPYGDPRRRALMGRERRPPGKRFYLSVFDYVFGPKQPAPDPLAADKAVVGFIRDADGRLTATDLVSLTGWSYQRADEEVTRLLVDYDGEPEVAEDGSLVYLFPMLRRTAAQFGPANRQLAARSSWSYAWSQPRALVPLTGNTDGANLGITAMNGFNLLAAFTIAPAFMLRFGVNPDLGVLVTGIPAAFSAIFFAVPGLRLLSRGRRRRRLLRDATRAAVLAEILAAAGEPVAPAALVAAAVKRGSPATPIEPPAAHKALEQLLLDLDGDVATADDGSIRYAFPRVAAELRAAESARRLAPATERDIGQVVFASDAEGTGELPELPAARPGVPKQLN